MGFGLRLAAFGCVWLRLGVKMASKGPMAEYCENQKMAISEILDFSNCLKPRQISSFNYPN